MSSTHGGGAATTAGTTFQEDVASYFAVQILAEQASAPPAGLQPDVTLEDIVAETTEAVDDLKIRTSRGGQLFIQVKTSLSFSSADDSVLADVISQFVSQYLKGVEDNGTHRQLDPDRDRLLLIVSQEAPSTISSGLRSLLGRLHSVGTESIFRELQNSISIDDKSQLQYLLDHMRRAWKAERDYECQLSDLFPLFKLCHVLSIDMTQDGPQMREVRHLLRTDILENPAEDKRALEVITDICRTFGPKRTGGNRDYFRQRLIHSSVFVKAPRSYDQPIRDLEGYTTAVLQHLRHLSIIEAINPPIKIERDIVTELYNFAASGHCVIVGEPGAGKSGCLHDFVDRCKRHSCDVVLFATDFLDDAGINRFTIASPGVRSYLEILINWTKSENGFVVIDALDAARTQSGLGRICQFLSRLMHEAPRWTVIIAMREYDLLYSRNVQALFKGVPHPTNSDSRFGKVRHLRVPRLTSDEISQVTKQAAPVKEVLQQASSDLHELLRNPFNLRLLCELIANQVGVDRFGGIRTQIGLLDLYWQVRVTQNEAQNAREESLKRLTTEMVQSRSLQATSRVNSIDIDHVNSLLSDGVLIEAAPARLAGGNRSLAFAHNILFDYAVARLILGELEEDVISYLSEEQNQDLVLAIRPSIVMAFQRLWHLDTVHSVFWEKALNVQSAPQLRLTGKIIAASVAAEEFSALNDYSVLLNTIKTGNDNAIALLAHIVTAAITRNEDRKEEFRLSGPGARPWMVLASEISEVVNKTDWIVRNLLRHIAYGKSELTHEDLVNSNIAARKLGEHELITKTSEQLSRSDRIPLRVICRTIAAAPEESVDLLNRYLEPDQVTNNGHIVLPAIAEYIDQLVSAVPDFALHFVKIAFLTKASREDAVPLGGRVFSLKTNRHDMLHMAHYQIAERFGQIMQLDPLTGTRIFITVFRSCYEQNHTPSDARIERFDFLGGKASIQFDYSDIWMRGGSAEHEEWYRISRGFEQALREMAEDSAKSNLISDIVQIIRVENKLAGVWSIMLELGAEKPGSIGLLLKELLLVPDILREADTRVQAGELITNVYSLLTPEERAYTENSIWSLAEHDVADPEQREYQEHDRDQMLGCIPRDLVETERVRKRLAELDATDGPPPIEPGFRITVGSRSHRERFSERGIDIDAAPNNRIYDLTGAIRKRGPSQDDDGLSTEQIDSLSQLLIEADEQIKNFEKLGIDKKLAEDASDELVAACAHVAASKSFSREHPMYAFVRDKLLLAANDPRPRYREEIDRQWDKGMASWGSPSPRIDAARGLMHLASRSESSSGPILEKIKELALDRVVSVRHQVSTRILLLWNIENGLMWSLISHFARTDERIGLLEFLMSAVLVRIPAQYKEKQFQLVCKVYRRTRHREHTEAIRRDSALVFVRLALWNDHARSKKILEAYQASPFRYTDEVVHLVRAAGGLLKHDLDDASPVARLKGRSWALSFLHRITDALLQEKRQEKYRSTNLSRELMSWLENIHHILRLLIHELDSIADVSDETDLSTNELTTLKVFFNETGPLLEKLCEVEFVDIAHDLLKVFKKLIPVDPERVFVLVAKLIDHATTDAIQHESIAADVVVEIIEEYLAEYRYIFRTQGQLRELLLDVLDTFVESGWPQAVKLTYRLDEVFR